MNFVQVNLRCDNNIIHSYNGLITLCFSIFLTQPLNNSYFSTTNNSKRWKSLIVHFTEKNLIVDSRCHYFAIALKLHAVADKCYIRAMWIYSNVHQCMFSISSRYIGSSIPSNDALIETGPRLFVDLRPDRSMSESITNCSARQSKGMREGGGHAVRTQIWNVDLEPVAEVSPNK